MVSLNLSTKLSFGKCIAHNNFLITARRSLMQKAIISKDSGDEIIDEVTPTPSSSNGAILSFALLYSNC